MTLNTREQEIFDLYSEDLQRLTFNSKPVISNLTELAYEYRQKFAHVIVRIIEDRIKKVPNDKKLPALYLMDSILKNHSDPYQALFQQNIVSTFAHVFLKSDEYTRKLMYKLRGTWSSHFSDAKLLQLDRKINSMDPAWPVAKPVAERVYPKGGTGSTELPPAKIHINPAVFGRQTSETDRHQEEIKRKRIELMELQKQKLDLELEMERKQIAEKKLMMNGGDLNVNKAVVGAAPVPQKVGPGVSAAPSSSTVSSGRIIVDQKKIRDPRVRDKLNKEINGKVDGNSAVDSLRSGRSSSKGPLDVKGHASSRSPAKDSKAKSRSPSPPQKLRQGLLSSSSPRSKVSSGDGRSKGTPPPPPTIRNREDYKSGRKRRREDKGGAQEKSGKGQHGGSIETEGVTQSLDHGARARSSSPSPPKSKSSGTRKPPQSRNFRIPKKQNTRSPSPQYSLEGPPLAEFSANAPPKQSKAAGKKRRQGPSGASAKKSKLNLEIFGEETAPAPLPSPSQGWAKFKETNPDEFRTPMDSTSDAFEARRQNEIETSKFGAWNRRGSGRGRFVRNSGRRGAGWHDRLEGARVFQPQDANASGMFGPSQPELVAILQNPEMVLEQVIPNIVKQGQDLLGTGKITSNKFSEMMKGVMQLKEKAHMQQAENRHRTMIENKNPNSQMPPHWQEPSNFGAQQPGAGAREREMTPASIGHANRDLPMADGQLLKEISDDPVKRIEIDNQPRDIRFYGETALIILGPEAVDMRELRFKSEFGANQRRVIFDGNIFVDLDINASCYSDFQLGDGSSHRVKIGAPTRELWIDGKWHELYFDKLGRFRIGGSMHDVYLEGPPPNVDIGKEPRDDLCVGTIQLIIDGDISKSVTIFLDSKPQLVDIAGKPHIFRFVQGLKLLLINGHPFRTEFGGTPMVVYVKQLRHFLRLTSLPSGVKVRNVSLWSADADSHQSPAPPEPEVQKATPEPAADETIRNTPSPVQDVNENSQDAPTKENNAFDRLLNLIPKKTSASNVDSHHNQGSGSVAEFSDGHYSSTPVGGNEAAENKDLRHPGGDAANSSVENKQTESAVPPARNVDVHDLWSQLLGAGLVSTPSTGGIPGLEAPKTDDSIKGSAAVDTNNEENAVPQVGIEKRGQEAPERAQEENKVEDIVMKSHDPSLKKKQLAVINMVYDPSALQCKSCGMRFPPSDMLAYSQHLDWHFRIRRREKDKAKRAESRQWYFPRLDWIVSDDIDECKDEDVESKSRSSSPNLEAPTVPASSKQDENACPICQEEFEQFFKEEFDDLQKGNRGKSDDSIVDDGAGRWHLRNAIRPPSEENLGNFAYHPQCYKDRHNNSSESSKQVPECSEDEVKDAKETTCQSAPAIEGEAASGSASRQLEDDTKAVDENRAEEEDQGNIKVEIGMEVDTVGDEERPDGTGEKQEQDESKENKEPEEPLKEPDETNIKQETAAEECQDDSPGKVVVGDENDADGEAVSPGNHLPPSDLLVASLPSAPPTRSIKINISANPPKAEQTESASAVSDSGPPAPGTSTVGDVLSSEFDPEAIIQMASEEEVELKPKLKDRKFVDMPIQSKDKELSGLCSIM